jgi:two-component sensor histidine kinase/response regulator RpfG family c-di-GMP phosphodiesterase
MRAMRHEKVNILLVDDQPAKLLSYEVVLAGLGENLIKANSATEALQLLLKHDVAVVLVDVCMPDLDGFDLVAMIREHPRFQQTAIIFISAISLREADHLRGYGMGAVDYVPVPVIPEVLRSKVRVFADLYRKTRELEELNRELETRVAERTAELEASTLSLVQSERRRSLALAGGQMGSWDLNVFRGECAWDEGQCRIFGVDPGSFVPTLETVRAMVHPEDWEKLKNAFENANNIDGHYKAEVRAILPDGRIQWCDVTATGTFSTDGKLIHVSGVVINITDRKEAEKHQALLAREVDHRAKNTLAVVQAIIRLTQAGSITHYIDSVEGRIRALAHTHNLLSASRWTGADLHKLVTEEMAPYRSESRAKVIDTGPAVNLPPATAQSVAMVLHELGTNAAKYGALSSGQGSVELHWELKGGCLVLQWSEVNGPKVVRPSSFGFGTKIINSTVGAQSGGRVDFDWRETGLQCTVTVPLEGHASVSTAQGDRPRGDKNVDPKQVVSKRILLVEDEMLVGMMMRDLLLQAGLSVIGPISSVSDALALVATQEIDAGVLDVNMGGEFVYPLAEQLKKREIPFIFVTGYTSESIDPRFRDYDVLQKPIDLASLKSSLSSIFAPEKPKSEPIVVNAKVATA